MKTIKVKVYQIHELPEKAQKIAFKNYLSKNSVDFWADEYKKTLDVFCDRFNVGLNHIDRAAGFVDLNLDYYTSEQLALTGVRLLKFLWNNFKKDLYKGKYYSTPFRNGAYKKRYSKCKLENSCVLTGFCADDDILGHIYAFMAKPVDDVDLEELLQNCVLEFLNSWQEDIDYQSSDEALTEHFNANDYFFTIDGKQF